MTPLTIPAALPPFAELLTYGAIQLFVERARTADSTFALTAENAPSVLEICQRLDGLPLALELAAARIRLLSPQELAARLDRRFSLLRAAPSEPAVHRGTRHKTLRATIDWGYDLLSPAEQALFRRLAVFAGGFTVAAAEAMAGEETLDLLDALVDQSFVMVECTADADRLYLLESLREYALEKLLTVGEEQTARQEHLAYFLALAETAATHFAKSTEHEWYNRLEQEHDNLRAALTWALATATDAGEASLRLCGALGRFWQVRGHLGEAKQALLQVLAAPHSPAAGQPATNWRAKALRWAGNIIHSLGDNRQALALLQESLALYQMVNDQLNIAHVLNVIGTIWDAQSNYTEALRYYEESQQIYRQLGDRTGIAVALNNCASVAHSQGDNVTARRLSEESIPYIRATGNQGQWPIC